MVYQKGHSFHLLFKMAVVVLLFWAVYHQVWQREDSGLLAAAFWRQLSAGRWEWLLAVVLLMPLNWSVETLKWMTLLQGRSSIRFRHAFQAVLAGVAVSLFTPNRMGEYGGRVLLVEARYQWLAVGATLVGSMAQWVALLNGGIWGAFYLAGTAWPDLVPGLSVRHWPVFLLTSVFLLLLYFFVDRLFAVFCRIPGKRFPGMRQQLDSLRCLNKGELARMLGWAMLRYSIYSVQYACMLWFFGVEMPPGTVLAGIAVLFLVQASVPLPPFLGLLARGELALLIWSGFQANELSVLAATFTLFIINLVLPALVGAVAIIRTNLIKSLGYDNEKIAV